MRNILILGAGKSSGALIDHLVDRSVEEQWQVTVADISAARRCKKLASALTPARLLLTFRMSQEEGD
ncbi:MAG: hypothetical protein IPP77_02070 [Bacteroidetes bacterium]|nr:hypothetical protein [Bacteroidota bacterium]